MKSPRISLLAIAAALALSGCADEFAAYNQVLGHRLLGVRATPPELSPGDSAVIDALVSSPAPTYSWSWCPLEFGGDGRDQCPVSEAELAAFLDAAGSDAEVPAYDLGTDPTASFEHSLPPELLASFCEQVRMIELPEGVARPRCDGRFEISLRLVVTSGEDRIEAARKLALVYDDAVVPNDNPAITGARIGVRGAPPFELEIDQPTMAAREVDYTLELDVGEDDAEVHQIERDGELVTERETLAITWFYEAGAMDKMRSSFIEGTTDFANLRTNRFRTPSIEELDANRTRLYFVLRDDRGGLDWFQAELELLP